MAKDLLPQQRHFSGWGFIARYPVAAPLAGNEKQHKKENPTYHSSNSVASGRGKGMVRICCVHPAITEEREKRYKKEKKKSLEWGREIAVWPQVMEAAACPCTHMYASMHTQARRQLLCREILWACCHALYEMGERTACQEECGTDHEPDLQGRGQHLWNVS